MQNLRARTGRVSFQQTLEPRRHGRIEQDDVWGNGCRDPQTAFGRMRHVHNVAITS
jgi:hypothetical protein